MYNTYTDFLAGFFLLAGHYRDGFYGYHAVICQLSFKLAPQIILFSSVNKNPFWWFRFVFFSYFRVIVMDRDRSKPRNKYERVMPRVYNHSRSSADPRARVTRHESSGLRVGAKPSVSNVSSNVFAELPTVLNDYIPEEPVKKTVKRSSVVKPRRTIKSLDPELSPYKTRITPVRPRGESQFGPRMPHSAPSARPRDADAWSEHHLRQCHSSRSHSQLKELKVC